MDRQIEKMASFAFITCTLTALVLFVVCMVVHEHSLQIMGLERSMKALQEQARKAK